MKAISISYFYNIHFGTFSGQNFLHRRFIWGNKFCIFRAKLLKSNTIFFFRSEKFFSIEHKNVDLFKNVAYFCTIENAISIVYSRHLGHNISITLAHHTKNILIFSICVRWIIDENEFWKKTQESCMNRQGIRYKCPITKP